MSYGVTNISRALGSARGAPAVALMRKDHERAPPACLGAACLAAFAQAGLHGCCNAVADCPVRVAAGTNASTQPTLVVMLVHTSGVSSAFPVTSRKVVAAAHTFVGWGPYASVQGLPMAAALPRPGLLKSLSAEDDWVYLYTTKDRFSPNLIDPQLVLRAGDPVLVAGYHGAAAPRDPINFGEFPPTIIRGRVAEPRPTVPGYGRVVAIEVPDGNYAGFSGGPAATVDPAGVVRVWGIVVRWYTLWGPWPPWRRRGLLLAARLPVDATTETTLER